MRRIDTTIEKYPDRDARAKAVREAVRDAVRTDALLGRSTCGTENGKVVWYTPAEALARLAATEEPNNADSPSK